MRIVIVAAATLITACATVERVADTPSGLPETTISGATVDQVMGVLINDMQDRGLVMQSQSRNSVVFTRVMEGSSGWMAQALLGNSYSTTPEAEFRYILTNVSGGVRVVAHMSISTQMAFGQVQRQSMNHNNQWFNDIYGFLNQLPIGNSSRQPSTPSDSLAEASKR